MRTKLRAWALTALLALATSCATSPTGRKQFIAVPDSTMDSMGQQAFAEMKTKTPVVQETDVNQYVKCVAFPVIQFAGDISGGALPPKDQWEVVVFRDETANAFALPGGKIGVHTGILKVAKNDAQLAAVLGHEVGHVIARHGAERVSQGLATQGGLAAIDAFVLGKDIGPGQRNLILGGLGLAATFGVILPYSRSHESEADLIGLDLMARAGFDPRQSVELWKNMATQSKGAPPEFLSTHPASQTRIDHLQANMGPAVKKYEQAKAAGRAPHCVLRGQ